jgi:hypothetical protein
MTETEAIVRRVVAIATRADEMKALPHAYVEPEVVQKMVEAITTEMSNLLARPDLEPEIASLVKSRLDFFSDVKLIDG